MTPKPSKTNLRAKVKKKTTLAKFLLRPSPVTGAAHHTDDSIKSDPVIDQRHACILD